MTTTKRWAGFRSLLCAIDFSEDSRLALRYAAIIAARSRASLKVIYVADPPLTARAAAVLHHRNLVTRSAVELRTFVATTLPAGAKRALRITQRVEIGDPATEIMVAASTARSDLLVLGTHGLTGLPRMLLGSTTLKLLQRTRVPVLAVPRARGRRIVRPPTSWPGSPVLAALEIGRNAAGDLDIAARIAQSFNSSLVLIHVISDIVQPAWLRVNLSRHDRERAARARQRIARLIRRTETRVPIDARVTCGRIADEIGRFSTAEHAGLVITALRNRNGWFGSGRGSISYHVLTDATTPVLAYPSGWRPR